MDTELMLSFDPSTDVVRVRTGKPLDESVAVPLRDLTILLSENLDGVVGIDIEDLPTFASRYISDALIPRGSTGEDLFRAAERHIGAMMSLFVNNLGPAAKDHVAHWDGLVTQVMAAKAARDQRP